MSDIRPSSENGSRSKETPVETTNGTSDLEVERGEPSRADEVNKLVQAVLPELVSFLHKADQEVEQHQNGIIANPQTVSTSIAHPLAASSGSLSRELSPMLQLSVHGTGQAGLIKCLAQILEYSVNPSAPGFLDKLYAAPLPPGIAAELILGVLNTNVHVYQVSPVLTLIEKYVARELAKLFGFCGSRSGGISVQGGSASNMTSIVIARNTLYPETKRRGNAAVKGSLVLFTSAHGHYSIEKAAQALGFGSESVVAVPVDKDGCMIPSALEDKITEANQAGKTPFYINATAGSTVLGSFDPFGEIGEIARKYRLWFHVDAAWGGAFVFSDRKDMKSKLDGAEQADSIATNPHKMLGVPVTCSFLLGRDLKQFEAANTLKAGYLFHDADSDDETEDLGTVDDETIVSKDVLNNHDLPAVLEDGEDWHAPDDLADLTLQCGRRGDALKLFLSWQYYGTKGYAEKIDKAYEIACHLSSLISNHPDLSPVLGKDKKPDCFQVCFYYTKAAKFAFGMEGVEGHFPVSKLSDKPSTTTSASTAKLRIGQLNTRITSKITRKLIRRGFMIDFAPALENQEDKGSFFRVAVNISTIKESVERLVEEIANVGALVMNEMNNSLSNHQPIRPSKESSA